MEIEILLKQRTNDTSVKVWFSCCPDDFSKYFENVTDDILDAADCAVYYCKDPDYYPGNIDDYYAYLASFSLFVFPVTKTFITGSSRAKDIDFEYAETHNVPILPILVEPGLYDMFNDFCTMQAIDRTVIDETTDTYKEKLAKFLNSSLIDADTIKRIRDAFNAYIFLSYRKKDRKYANSIMSMIHDNEFMRDTAIWYDEFLTPGEDFNDEIKDNLLKSKLVAMVVTPNINERGNYVIEHEYPMAVSENKKIFPIEAVKTDIAKLSSNFINLADPVSMDNTESITEYFRGFVVENGLKEDNDPIHLYFIALAYLYGIDVEKNTERAISILEKCEKLFYKKYLPREMRGSELGEDYYNSLRRLFAFRTGTGVKNEIEEKEYCPPLATLMLVRIFENGIGAPIDYKRAYEHQRLLVAWHWNQYNVQQDKIGYSAYDRKIIQRLKLGELAFKCGMYQEMDVRDLPSSSDCKDIGNGLVGVYCDYYRAKCFDRTGEHEKAEVIYEKIYKIISCCNSPHGADIPDSFSSYGYPYQVVNKCIRCLNNAKICGKYIDKTNITEKCPFAETGGDIIPLCLKYIASDQYRGYLSEPDVMNNCPFWKREFRIKDISIDELKYIIRSEALIININCDRGLNKCYLGKIEEGIALIEESIKNGFEDEMSDVLALSYYIAKDYQKAYYYAEKCIKWCAGKLENDDPKLLTCRTIIADSAKCLYDYAKAESELSHIIEDKKRIFGEYHLETVESVLSRAECLIALERVSEGLTLYGNVCDALIVKCVTDNWGEAGNYNQDSLNKYNTYIHLLMVNGYYEKAVEKLERIYFIRNVITDTEEGYFVYIGNLRERPKRINYEMILKDLEKLLFSNGNAEATHRYVNYIAEAYMRSARYTDAVNILDRYNYSSFDIHNDTESCVSMQIICECCKNTGRLFEAMEIAEALIMLFSDRLGADHADTLYMRLELYDLYCALNEDMLQYYDDVRTVCANVFKKINLSESNSEDTENTFNGYLFDRNVFQNHECYINWLKNMLWKESAFVDVILEKIYTSIMGSLPENDDRFLMIERDRFCSLYKNTFMSPYDSVQTAFKLYKSRNDRLGDLNKATLNALVIGMFGKYKCECSDVDNHLAMIYKELEELFGTEDQFTLFALNVFFNGMYNAKTDMSKTLIVMEIMDREAVVNELEEEIAERKERISNTSIIRLREEYENDNKRIMDVLQTAFYV